MAQPRKESFVQNPFEVNELIQYLNQYVDLITSGKLSIINKRYQGLLKDQLLEKGLDECAIVDIAAFNRILYTLTRGGEIERRSFYMGYDYGESNDRAEKLLDLPPLNVFYGPTIPLRRIKKMKSSVKGLILLNHGGSSIQVKKDCYKNPYSEISDVQGSDSSSFLIRYDGECYSVGIDNSNGQLGLGKRELTKSDKKTPIKINEPVKSIITDEKKTLFLCYSGNVWLAGSVSDDSEGSDVIIRTNPYLLPISDIIDIRRHFMHGFEFINKNNERLWLDFTNNIIHPIFDEVNKISYVYTSEGDLQFCRNNNKLKNDDFTIKELDSLSGIKFATDSGYLSKDGYVILDDRGNLFFMPDDNLIAKKIATDVKQILANDTQFIMLFNNGRLEWNVPFNQRIPQPSIWKLSTLSLKLKNQLSFFKTYSKTRNVNPLILMNALIDNHHAMGKLTAVALIYYIYKKDMMQALNLIYHFTEKDKKILESLSLIRLAGGEFAYVKNRALNFDMTVIPASSHGSTLNAFVDIIKYLYKVSIDEKVIFSYDDLSSNKKLRYHDFALLLHKLFQDELHSINAMKEHLEITSKQFTHYGDGNSMFAMPKISTRYHNLRTKLLLSLAGDEKAFQFLKTIAGIYLHFVNCFGESKGICKILSDTLKIIEAEKKTRLPGVNPT